jgi:hypothetical protein
MTEKQTIDQQAKYKKYLDDFEKSEQDVAKNADLALQDFTKLDNIAGLPLDPKEKAEFADTFKYILKRNPDNGLNILDVLLQSNEFLMKAVYLGLKAEPKFRAAITEAKEGVKKTMIDKLDKQPDLGRGHNMSGSPLQIDYDAIAAPEQY